MRPRWVWRAPPGWPQPPVGWSPPPGWNPPEDWPTAPKDWQWWQALPPSPARFHVVGVVFLAAALLGWGIVVAALGFVSAKCAPSPGNPALLHLGVAGAGLLVVAVPARWTWRARGWCYRWRPWLVTAVLVLAVVIYAAFTVSTPGCPFVF